jgi:hypothetical protein
MKNANSFLDNAMRNANADFANADGQFANDMYFSGGETDFFSASGDAGNIGGTSQPYIITVTSTSGSAVANFDVLGSYEYLTGPTGTWTNGNLVIGSVTISSGTPNITYQQMLWQFQNAPFSVGLTYVQSATTNQVTQTFSIVTKDANGNIAQRPIVPTVDPYQFQSGIIPVSFGYRIDGFTKLTFSQILANATLTLQFYPSDNINVARGLAGSPVARQFRNPQIIKAQPIKMIG